MSRFLLFISSLVMVGQALAEPIRIPGSFFREESFRRSFVGSYGFLSPVEPKVSREESEVLLTVRELFEKGKFSRAESELKQFITSLDGVEDEEGNPIAVSPAMVFVLGTLYFQSDKLEEARRSYLEAIRRYPRFRRAHTNLGYLYAKQEKLDKALPHLQQSIELGENSHRIYGLIGFAYLVADNPVAAETAYRQAIMLNAANSDWKLGLAQSLLAQEKFEEASALLATLIAAKPNEKQLYLQQTNALLEMDKKIEAAANLEVLRLRGLANEADLNLLGNIYMDQEQPQLALFAYIGAIEMEKELDIARNLKSARILNDYGYPEKATVLVEKVRSKAGDKLAKDDQVQLLLVDLKIANSAEDLKRVGELVESLVKLAPSHGEVLLETGRYYEALAESDDENRDAHLREARTHFSLATKVEKTAYQANLALGQQFVRERRYLDGLPYLKKALELNSSDGLKQHFSRVQRAADREKQNNERDAKAREAAASRAKEEKK